MKSVKQDSVSSTIQSQIMRYPTFTSYVTYLVYVLDISNAVKIIC